MERQEILRFARGKLEKKHHPRNDYLELIELSIMIVDLKKNTKKLKIRPPGAMHQARFMCRAIYLLKMYLLRYELNLDLETRKSLEDLCIFIVKVYLKAWFNCPYAEKSPQQDLMLLKQLKGYHDPAIAEAALSKLCQHLWYLSDEHVALSFFDDSLDLGIKIKMAKNLSLEKEKSKTKFYVHPSDINEKFFGEFNLI